MWSDDNILHDGPFRSGELKQWGCKHNDNIKQKVRQQLKNGRLDVLRE